jgi:CRISPR-associated endonuclease Cas1
VSGKDWKYPRRAAVMPDPRVLVVDGYAATLAVRGGHLVVKSDGTEQRVPRIEAIRTRDGIARILIFSRVGSVTMEVTRWCESLGIAMFQVSRDGSIGFCTPGLIPKDARLIKRQVQCQPDGVDATIGLGITRNLLTEKVYGQLRNLELMTADTSKHEESLKGLATAPTIRAMQGYEGHAAIAYWKEWKNRVHVPFDKIALHYVPEHWQRFNGRTSVNRTDGFTESSNQNATDFVNACLNYAYKIAETEAMYACAMLGLHPGIGISHDAIYDNKAALALDVLEPLRPVTDSVVLSYLEYGRGAPMTDDGKPFRISKDSVYELETGVCRLVPPITSYLASAVSMTVAPVAIRIAEMIATAITTTRKAIPARPVDPRLHQRENATLLHESVTVVDLVPDNAWTEIQSMLPRYGRYETNERAILAAIVAHETYNVSWHTSADRFSQNYRSVRKRFDMWSKTGLLDQILSIIAGTPTHDKDHQD